MAIAGLAAAALGTLSSEQILFLKSIPKAELHAHLNGSIPISVLQELASEYLASRASGSVSRSTSSSSISDDSVIAGIEKLKHGPVLGEIMEFFSLFPAIYALTSTPEALKRATRAVLSTFLDGDLPECNYLELRTTPRQTPAMDREQYLLAVLAEIELYDADKVGLIVSIDRRMGEDVLKDCLRAACKLKTEGHRVIGLDLCGDPTAGDVETFAPYFVEAKKGGLGLTVHIAEVITVKFCPVPKLMLPT